MCQRIYMRQYASSPKKEWIQRKVEERLHGTAEGTSSATRLANSSAASFFGRNECPGTRCSLIVNERTEQESKEEKR